MMNLSVTPRVTKILGTVTRFTPVERLTLAKLLLDSLLIDEKADEVDWMKLGLTAFEKDWDNEEDAIFDNWREFYGVSTG
jgi:hypothetical protein